MIDLILKKLFSLNWILFYHVLIENFEKFILYTILGLLSGILLAFIFNNIKKISSNNQSANDNLSKTETICSSSYYDNLSLKLRTNKRRYKQNIPVIKYTDSNSNNGGIINLNQI